LGLLVIREQGVSDSQRVNVTFTRALLGFRLSVLFYPTVERSSYFLLILHNTALGHKQASTMRMRSYLSTSGATVDVTYLSTTNVLSNKILETLFPFLFESLSPSIKDVLTSLMMKKRRKESSVLLWHLCGDARVIEYLISAFQDGRCLSWNRHQVNLMAIILTLRFPLSENTLLLIGQEVLVMGRRLRREYLLQLMRMKSKLRRVKWMKRRKQRLAERARHESHRPRKSHKSWHDNVDTEEQAFDLWYFCWNFIVNGGRFKCVVLCTGNQVLRTHKIHHIFASFNIFKKVKSRNILWIKPIQAIKAREILIFFLIFFEVPHKASGSVKKPCWDSLLLVIYYHSLVVHYYLIVVYLLYFILKSLQISKILCKVFKNVKKLYKNLLSLIVYYCSLLFTYYLLLFNCYLLVISYFKEFPNIKSTLQNL